MTTINVITELGRWAEAAEALGALGFTLTVENTVVVEHRDIVTIQKVLTELWWLAAYQTIVGFSVEASDIKAA